MLLVRGLKDCGIATAIAGEIEQNLPQDMLLGMPGQPLQPGICAPQLTACMETSMEAALAALIIPMPAKAVSSKRISIRI